MCDYRWLTYLLHINERTWEELLGWSTELDLFIYLERHVHLLCARSGCAQPCLQGHALHAIRKLQYAQDID